MAKKKSESKANTNADPKPDANPPTPEPTPEAAAQAPEQVDGVRFFSDFTRYNFAGLVQFEGGRATVTDPAIVARMEAHEAYGRDYQRVPA